ncbi:MAG: hypothetical protein AAGG07_12590 [Planctomycetota bacterium]
MTAVPGVNGSLWSSLARPEPRPQPAKGADVLGERVNGIAARITRGRTERRRIDRICDLSDALSTRTEAELDELVAESRQLARLHRLSGESLDRALAAGRVVIARELGLMLHPEQVMGAAAMLRGCVAEMATGEGKTVTAILAASVMGWAGHGVHVLTVNDYLASRDAESTRPAYERMGLAVGVLRDEHAPPERRAAYAADVMYAAEKQVIFDALRDRLVAPVSPRLSAALLDELTAHDVRARGDRTELGRERWSRLIVQRGLHAAIIDEADSILIDEAITPAIIGEGGSEEAPAEHHKAAGMIADGLHRDEHYRVDDRARRVRLTDRGRAEAERRAHTDVGLPVFWAGPRRREELVGLALEARELYLRDSAYIVQGDEVVIVDESTGRLLNGRRWQRGLHQAVEAKEGLPVRDDRQTTARIGYQRFFQRYRWLAGMSGTAWEVRHELWASYRLPVARIPTHRPVIRTRGPDRVFRTERAKVDAVVDRAKRYHAGGRPVLIGTRSVADSERVARALESGGVPCRVLNATREAEEAAIVAEAGRTGAVTVATNMAGRGTDIKLDDDARMRGGLVVIATEHHDERRVDRQLFGRAGRQGDPGHAEVFCSLDDELIRRHGLSLLKRFAVIRDGGTAGPLSKLLWWAAQATASGTGRVLRAETAKQEAADEVAWADLAR